MLHGEDKERQPLTWARGQDETKYPKAAVCQGTDQAQDRNTTSLAFMFRLHERGWFTQTHLKPSNHFFFLSREKTKHLTQDIRLWPALCQSIKKVKWVCLTYPLGNFLPISGQGMNSWDSDPGSKMLFLPPPRTAHLISIYPCNPGAQTKLVNSSLKRKELVMSRLEAASGAGGFPHSSQSPLDSVVWLLSHARLFCDSMDCSPTISTYIQRSLAR